MTNIPHGVWNWQPLRALENPWARLLWWAMLTTAEAKRCPPGLFHGGPASMFEASGIPYDEVVKGMRDLALADLVEYDELTRVTRYTRLPPDKIDAAHSGSVIQSWWTRFGAIPACDVRNAHVPLLRWLCEPFEAKGSKGVWERTFGTIAVPRRQPRQEALWEGADQGGGQGVREGVGQGVSSNDSNSRGQGVGDPPRHPQDPEPDLDQGEEMQEERDPGGSRAELAASAAAVGIPVCGDLDPGIAAALAGSLTSWRPPPDVREARRTEALRAESLADDRRRG